MAYDNPIPPKGLGCHRTGFEKNCRDLIVDGRCDRWRNETVLVNGMNTVVYDCVDNWLAQYTRDVIAQNNGMSRAVESLRNELMALAGHPNGHPAAVPVGREFGVQQIDNHDQKLITGKGNE